MIKIVSKKQLREFGYLIGIGFPLILGLIIPTLTGHGFREWSLWIGIPALLLGIFQPRLLLYPYKAWMALGLILGWINSRIILGLVFLIILLPIAFFMKCGGYDPLRQKPVKGNSYRERKKAEKINLTRIF